MLLYMQKREVKQIMETKLFYVVEDDVNVREDMRSSLFTSKKAWLESIRYSLDVAVEYEDMTEDESDTEFNRIKRNPIGKYLKVNGFYYNIEEIVVVYQDNDILIRYEEIANKYMLYKFFVDAYEFVEFTSELKAKEYTNND